MPSRFSCPDWVRLIWGLSQSQLGSFCTLESWLTSQSTKGAQNHRLELIYASCISKIQLLEKIKKKSILALKSLVNFWITFEQKIGTLYFLFLAVHYIVWDHTSAFNRSDFFYIKNKNKILSTLLSLLHPMDFKIYYMFAWLVHRELKILRGLMPNFVENSKFHQVFVSF